MEPIRTTQTRRGWRVLGALGLVALLSIAALSLTACAQPQPETPTEAPPQETPAPEPTVTEPEAPADMQDTTELKIEDLEVGTGAEAVAGKTVTVNYVGWLTDGTKFDSSYESGQPFSFPLGGGQVIPGWDEGIVGMKVGGKRLLTIPPDKGYGPQGYPPTIPPNATLVFHVELLGVQ